ncbi:GNAT family N-acetyltransferase [Xylanimonas sp. McL0601]|uniref:GNAT family N-acetyltransferase n=1 Tax=Xylanimonas sp. McL0601 TaxID=3414739 RepID=UPI003CE75639
MTVDLEGVTIRPATPDDALHIAQVHVTSWQGAYAGLLPAAYLADLDPAMRVNQWASVLGTKGGSPTEGHVLVAELGGHTLGFASFGLSADEDAEPGTRELYAMYLEPDAWGKGVARELMRTVLAEIPASAAMTLWVLEGNERARHFYRRHGFHPDGVERIDEIGGVPLTELRYRRAAA